MSPNRGPDGSGPREKEQAVVPLEMVPVEAAAGDDQRAREKRAAKQARQEARNVAIEVLAAGLHRLGRVELTKEMTSGVTRSKEETSEGSQPYMPEWPHVTKGSNLATGESRLEWLRNCLPPNVMEGYKDLGVNLPAGLNVQAALLGIIEAVQTERLLGRQSQHLREWKRACKSAEETAEVGKTTQRELAAEVAALTADLTQAQEQRASQEYVLSEKEMELAAKDEELTSWAAEAAQMQQEIEWERGEKEKTQAKIVALEERLGEVQAALSRAEDVRKFLMEAGIREIVRKIFASDEYVSEVAKLVPLLQASGRVEVLRMLQAEYLPDKEVKDLPGYVEGAGEASNAAFAEMQKGLK